MLYLEEDDKRCPTLALRQVFLSTLCHWLNAASENLFFELSDDSERLIKVVVVELLHSPFYLCVSPHIPTLLSDEIYH